MGPTPRKMSWSNNSPWEEEAPLEVRKPRVDETLTIFPGATLRNHRDLRTLFQTTMYFVLTWVLWTKDEAMHPALVFGLWWLVTWYAFVGATITHNTMHCKVFRQYLPNKLFQVALTLTYGHPVSTYVPGHNLSHHQFTQHKKDIMRTSKVRYKWHLLNLMTFQPKVAGHVARSDLRYLRLQVALGNGFWKQALREFAVLILVQVVLAVLDWRRFLLYFYIPHVVAQWGIVTINVLQHDGCDTPDERQTTPNSARNFTGWLLNWMTMNNGYHCVHHLHPTTHWSKYPELHAKEIKPNAHPNLDQESIIGYTWRTFVWPGRRETYDGKPVELLEECPDADWIDYPAGFDPRSLDLTPLKVAQFFGDAVVLMGLKIVSPIYSPIINLA